MLARHNKLLCTKFAWHYLHNVLCITESDCT